MELHEANRILRSVKSALYADGMKLPPSADADALMMLLGKTDCDKLLAPKIKHSKSLAPDSAAFKRQFGYFAFFRALEAMKGSLADPVTSTSVMLLHKTVCGDLDPEAGKPRAADVATNGSAHTDPKYVSGSLKSIIAKMNDIASSPNISKEDFAGYLTHYMRELVILHPFERGSEFMCRLFLMLFAKLKGFSLCYYRTPFSELRAAEEEAFLSDDVTALYKALLECLSYERTSVQPPQRITAQTRRELNSRARKISPAAPPRDEIASVKLKALEQNKQKTDRSDDVLKRAIKLQQKITKLNEQLSELMTSTGGGQKRPSTKLPKPQNAANKTASEQAQKSSKDDES